jgi:hypothetical protein
MAIFGKRSENTCNALLCEELRKLGVEAFFEEHFLTQFGRSKPDVYVRYEGVNYFVEGKQRPRKLVDAVSSAYTYQRKLQVYSPKAIFAVLYPEDCLGFCEAAVLLDFPPFYLSHKTKSLQDLAKWIYNIIIRPPVTLEFDVSDAIHLLREAVIGISEALTRVKAKDVEEIFGGRLFFETVLGVKEEKEIPIKHLRDAAAYLLVNQILFYQILAREKKGIIRYREIDAEKLKTPRELQDIYFSRVLLEDYKPIFGFNVASKIKGSKALEAVKVTINAINALSPQSLSHDVLGKIFHNLIPLELRKIIAAFYTNVQAGEILATLAIDNPHATVIDPACGSGTLLVSAYRRKKELLNKNGSQFTFTHHKKFVEEEITGIDIMPFAAHLAAVHLALQAPLFTTDFVRIAIEDSTRLYPGVTLAPAQERLKEAFKQRKLDEDYSKPVKKKEKIQAGVVELYKQLTVRPIKLDKVDLVIMNPPFTRFQRIPPEYKRKLLHRFSDSKYKKCVHGQLGFHGYFLLLADKFLKKGGRLAAVLPVTTLSAKGLYKIQELWLKNYTLEFIIACEGRSAFSEDVRTREILFVAKKEKSQNNNKVGVVILKVPPDKLSLQEAHFLAETFKDLKTTTPFGKIVESDKFMFRTVPQTDLSKTHRGMFRAISLYRKDLIEIYEELLKFYEKSGKIITLGDYFKKIGGELHESPRGIKKYGYYGLSIIRDEERALKKHDIWILKEKRKNAITVENRFSKIRHNIPIESVFPNIRRYAGLKKMNISDSTDYLIFKPFKGIRDFLKDSEISEEERAEALTRVGNGFWYKLVKENSSKVAMIYRANLTADMTHNLAFYSDSEMFFGGSFWRVLIDDVEQAKLFTLWINSTLNLFQFIIERKETEGGWVWFDDYVLREFSIPDFTQLQNYEIGTILSIFEKYGKTPVPNIITQIEQGHLVRRKIDSTLLQILGFNEDKINSFLRKLYDIILNELVKLKRVMGGS